MFCYIIINNNIDYSLHLIVKLNHVVILWSIQSILKSIYWFYKLIKYFFFDDDIRSVVKLKSCWSFTNELKKFAECKKMLKIKFDVITKVSICRNVNKIESIFFLNIQIKCRNIFLSKIHSKKYFKISSDSIDEKFDCSCWNFKVSRTTITVMCQIFFEILRTNAYLLRRNFRNRKTINMKTKCNANTTLKKTWFVDVEIDVEIKIVDF